MSLKIPNHHLSLYDYHHIADVVDNKRFGAGIYIPQSMIFELEPELEHDYVTKQKFELCRVMFDWHTENHIGVSLPKSTMYLLYASFFYDKYKEYTDLDEICSWSTEGIPEAFDLSGQMKKKMEPFLKDADTRDKLNAGMQRRLDRFISRIGVILEQKKEKEIEDGSPIIGDVGCESETMNVSHFSPMNLLNNNRLPKLFVGVMRDDAMETDYHNDRHNIVMLFGGTYSSPEHHIALVNPAVDMNNGNLSIKECEFKGFHESDKIYNRGDCASYSKGFSILDFNFHICLKDNTSTENPVDSEYWYPLNNTLSLRIMFDQLVNDICSDGFGVDER